MKPMRRVVRVAAYLPSGRSDGRAVAAVDEDEFTLGATAVERAWASPREEPGAVSVHLFGEFPPVGEWGFLALLGREGEVVRHPNEASELGRTLRELEEGAGGPALVVAAELPERAHARAAHRAGSPGAASVAYLLESSEDAGPLELAKPAAGRSAVTSTLRLGGPRSEVPRTVTLVGDWERLVPVPPAAAGKSSGAWKEANLSAVSEGAYVPRARYLENLPSRWRFRSETCRGCGGTTFPARGICRRCGRSDALTVLALPLDGGRVVAITTVGKGGQPTEFDPQVEAFGPYDVALVELARGMRVTLQVTDCPAGTLHVGDRVNTMLRRLYPMEGEWRYGRKAVPARSSMARGPAG